jgi:hypothetical protein
VKNAAWAKSDIDRFVLSRLEKEGWSPSPSADRARLLRRVSLDLTGIPPTSAEVDAFLADKSPQAYEKSVDRLLASPRYGEHWAAWWLDLARYADTQGYEKDNRRTIWRYRDWVIRALNQDLPFDQFTVEQIAGDMLDNPTIDQRIATAFHRNTMTNTEGGTDDEEFRVAAVVDRVNTTFQVWMATTMNCCQCHSHKYDPFTQREYYRFFALLDQTEDADRNNEAPTIRTPTAEQAKQRQQLQSKLDAAKSELAAAGDDAKKKEEINKQVADLEKQLKAVRITTTPIMRQLPPDRQRKTHFMIRGSFLSKGDEVRPGLPLVLPPLEEGQPMNRLGMAHWLVSRENPLTARVLANRFWEQLFGTGLVQTSEDFGTQGDLPTHPELLDHLAVSLMEDGWSMKRLLKRIAMSSTYRQSARVSPELLEKDPLNRLLARGPRVRLSAEQLRDQALAASGLLHEKLGGPSVMPPQPAAIWQVVYSGDRWTTATGSDRYRRALYTFWRRTSPYPSMTTFDAPSREFCVVRRIRTNTPLQALVALNDPAFVEAAQALARKAVAEGGESAKDRVAFAFRRCLARSPSEKEIVRLVSLLDTELEHYRSDAVAARAMATDPLGPLPANADAAELAAWTVVANVILNLDETITK